ncbi:MAG TPA: Dabb family protein [Vicinamibacteria bacterium]
MMRPTRAVLATAVAVLAAPVLSQAPAPAPAASQPAVVHVVLFTLEPGAKPEDAAELIADSRRLLAQVPGVEDIRVGRKAKDDRDVHVKDYEVGLLVRVRGLTDLAAYAAHPKHRELVEKWRGRARWKVIDFFAE